MEPYFPADVFADSRQPPPKVLVSPQRYIQGPGVIKRLASYLSLLNVKSAGLLVSERGLATQGAVVLDRLKTAGIEGLSARFNGECSRPEIEMHVEHFRPLQIGCLIAAGGGKVIDAGRAIAHRLSVPVVVVPTLASNDAPCSALSVIYTQEGVADSVEFYPVNPALVVVDTDVIAQADERFLVAGIGDAMATWYEARVCQNNPRARTSLGVRPTITACAIGEACAHTLYEFGEKAAASVSENINDDAVEKVVEANTLMSGVGFESGGLALAHALALSFTEITSVHDQYLHGEMVAMGTMAQLAMEKSADARKAAIFFAKVGLPIHLGQLSLSPKNHKELDVISAAAEARPIAHNMPMAVTQRSIKKALLAAHDLGLEIAQTVGDNSYQRLQS